MTNTDAAAKDEYLGRVDGLLPKIAARAFQTDADRRVSQEIVDELIKTKLLDLLVPAELGGLESDFSLYSAITRRLATACGSTAWVYAVLAECAWISALFPKKAQDEVWREHPIICGSLVPFGKADRVNGGYRISGRWGYLSGSEHANWVVLSATCADAGGAVLDLLVPKAEIKVQNDWRVLGLSATSSNSALVEDVFVPDWRTVPHASLLSGTSPGRDIYPTYPLARAPRGLLVAFSLTPVIVGLATRALEICTDTLRQSAPAPTPDWVAMQSKYSEATMDVDLANLIMDTHGPRNDNLVRSDSAIGEREIARARLAASHMSKLAKQAIEGLTYISGTRWLFETNPMQLILRDAVAASTHRASNWEMASLAYCASLGLAGRKENHRFCRTVSFPRRKLDPPPMTISCAEKGE